MNINEVPFAYIYTYMKTTQNDDEKHYDIRIGVDD